MLLNELGFATKHQLLFQSSATPFMEGIVDLHHTIMFFLIIILIFVLWLVFCVLYLYVEKEIFFTKGLSERRFYWRVFKDTVTPFQKYEIYSINSINLVEKICRLLNLKSKFFFTLFKFLKFPYDITSFQKFINRSISMRYNHGTIIEFLWTMLPCVVLFLIAIPSYRLLYAIDDVTTVHVLIKVIGHQWYWTYEYTFLYDKLSMLQDKEYVQTKNIVSYLNELLEGNPKLSNHFYHHHHGKVPMWGGLEKKMPNDLLANLKSNFNGLKEVVLTNLTKNRETFIKQLYGNYLTTFDLWRYRLNMLYYEQQFLKSDVKTVDIDGPGEIELLNGFVKDFGVGLGENFSITDVILSDFFQSSNLRKVYNLSDLLDIWVTNPKYYELLKNVNLIELFQNNKRLFTDGFMSKTAVVCENENPIKKFFVYDYNLLNYFILKDFLTLAMKGQVDPLSDENGKRVASFVQSFVNWSLWTMKVDDCYSYSKSDSYSKSVMLVDSWKKDPHLAAEFEKANIKLKKMQIIGDRTYEKILLDSQEKMFLHYLDRAKFLTKVLQVEHLIPDLKNKTPYKGCLDFFIQKSDIYLLQWYSKLAHEIEEVRAIKAFLALDDVRSLTHPSRPNSCSDNPYFKKMSEIHKQWLRPESMDFKHLNLVKGVNEYSEFLTKMYLFEKKIINSYPFLRSGSNAGYFDLKNFKSLINSKVVDDSIDPVNLRALAMERFKKYNPSVMDTYNETLYNRSVYVLKSLQNKLKTWEFAYLMQVFGGHDPQSVIIKNVEITSYMLPEDDLKLGDLRLLEVDNVLYVPAHVHVHFFVTSADVLHSWAVPSLGVKIDAVPGRLNEVSVYIARPGIYYGQCSEICGVNHAFMPIVIVAYEPKVGGVLR